MLVKVAYHHDLQVIRTRGAVSPQDIRASILHQQSPIHSYLFDKHGDLLVANTKAAAKWKAKGRSWASGWCIACPWSSCPPAGAKTLPWPASGVEDVQKIRLEDVLEADGAMIPLLIGSL